jgi:hypothetical protein
VTVRDAVARGTIGPVHAIELVFHNAYGPDKRWFQDPALSREGRDAVVETTFRGHDARGGRAAVQWARRPAAGERYDLHSRRLVTVAEVIDRIYAR